MQDLFNRLHTRIAARAWRPDYKNVAGQQLFYRLVAMEQVDQTPRRRFNRYVVL